MTPFAKDFDGKMIKLEGKTKNIVLIDFGLSEKFKDKNDNHRP